MRKWESLDREQVSKSNVMEQGAWVQQGDDKGFSEMGFSPHPASHIKDSEVKTLIRHNTGLYNV